MFHILWYILGLIWFNDIDSYWLLWYRPIQQLNFWCDVHSKIFQICTIIEYCRSLWDILWLNNTVKIIFMGSKALVAIIRLHHADTSVKEVGMLAVFVFKRWRWTSSQNSLQPWIINIDNLKENLKDYPIFLNEVSKTFLETWVKTSLIIHKYTTMQTIWTTT